MYAMALPADMEPTPTTTGAESQDRSVRIEVRQMGAIRVYVGAQWY